VRGAAAVAASVQRQRDSDFRIYPVPTRLEDAETDKLEVAMAFAKRMFAPFLTHVQGNSKSMSLREQEKYWVDVRTPYRTFYAFEEVPACFKDQPGRHDTILASTERLSAWITNGKVSALRPVDEARRQTVIAAYAFTTLELPELGAARDAFVTGTPDSTEIAGLLISGLHQSGLSIENVRFEELGEVRGGWPASVEQSRNGIFIFGKDQTTVLETYLRRFVQQTLDAESDRAAIPVIMGRNSLVTLPAILRSWQISVSGPEAIPNAVEKIRAILVHESEAASGQGSERPTGSAQAPPGYHIAIESVASADPITREAGARALSRMGTREADEKLMQYISDEDETLRGLATEAAQRTDIYTERFLAELEDVDVEKRIRAAAVLGVRKEARACWGLVRLLNDSAGGVRRAGASALGRLGDPIALDWLLPRLSDPESEVRRAVAISVIQMAAVVDNDTFRQLRDAICQVIASGNGREATEALLGPNDGNPRIRDLVDPALASVTGPAATTALIKGLDHTDPQVRFRAARALASVSRPEATEALIKGLDDGDPEVRLSVAKALARVSRPEVTEALIRRLDDADPQVRITVAQALATVNTPEAQDALISALSELMNDRTSEIRRTALALRAESFDPLQKRLLTQDFDGMRRWLDPSVGIDRPRVASAAKKLRIPEVAVITHYEEINRLLNDKLIFNWSQVAGEPSPPQAAQPAQGPSLTDAVLTAVKEHPEGATANEILSYLSRVFGMTVKPNHVGISLQRHRRAGRLENRDQKWYLPQEAQRLRSNH
jgi:HEAT repeat protein